MLNKDKILMIETQYGSGFQREHGLYGGVGYYRQRMIAKHLPEYSCTHAGHILTKTKPEEMEKVIIDLVKNNNLVYTKHLDNPNIIYMLLGACDYYDKPLIVDLDDNFFATDGMSYEKHVYPEGSELKRYVEVLLEECSAITVSTKPLLKNFKQYNENIYHLPNSCDEEDWKLPKRKHKRPTVGWVGSTSHIVDHPILEEVYAKVSEKHPDVVFSFTGQTSPELLKGIKRENWEILPATKHWKPYPRMLADYGYDVGLAPLIKSQYNEARSNVKWMEYTMTGTPTVASNFGPYKELKDGKEILLADTPDQWADAINKLLDTGGEYIIKNARDRITREFSIKHTIKSWRETFEKHIKRGFHS